MWRAALWTGTRSGRRVPWRIGIQVHCKKKKKRRARLLAVSQAERQTNGRRRKRPLDDVERAERTVLWRETVERGVERDADVVQLLSEDRGDVAE